MNRISSFVWLLCACAGSGSAAGDVDYEHNIRPVLKARCWSCHGALQQQSSLRLDTVASMTQGGDSGPAIVGGELIKSPLWQRITATDNSERMPPEGPPLSADEIESIGNWIVAGAVGPANESPEPDPRDHWSFRTPVRPEAPAAIAGRSVHPIDVWIGRTLDREGLTPAPPADRATLLRRVYLDLVGMPPTVEELNAFLAQDSHAAYEQVVDALLHDPRYGERWGRHWLDIWRYSDWYGRRHVPDVWNSASQIWRWRDWVVRSLNEDLGYDQMLRLMLAADEIAPEDPDVAVATGYLIRNWYALNPNDWMRNTVEHTGKAFLGLTFNCAHCHDHKYDPISHDDYFRLRAYFEPIAVRQDRVPGQPDPGMFQEYSYGVLR
ncbi:MAG: colicin uptake protein, partial [Planctomycetales bacterium 12-60-4]